MRVFRIDPTESVRIALLIELEGPSQITARDVRLELRVVKLMYKLIGRKLQILQMLLF